MADRAVQRTRKDEDGDILALCDDGASWSPRMKSDAIADIESGLHTYHVPWPSGRTEIRIVNGSDREVPSHRPRRHLREQPRRSC